MMEYRTQVRRWWVETGWVDGNGVGLWDGTQESVEVPSKEDAEKLRDAWLVKGKLIRDQWDNLRPPHPYGSFRIRSDFYDVPLVEPAAELTELKRRHKELGLHFNTVNSYANQTGAEVLRLRAENAQLVAANQELVAREAEAREVLSDIARQTLSTEMSRGEAEAGDWAGGFDMCVRSARAFLAGKATP